MIRRAVMSDAPLAALGLNDTAVAVVDRDVAGVADDVAGLRLRKGVDLLACRQPFAGCSVIARIVTGVPEDCCYEVRAVDAAGQGVAAPDVRVADELVSITHDVAAASGTARGRAAGAAGRRA